MQWGKGMEGRISQFLRNLMYNCEPKPKADGIQQDRSERRLNGNFNSNFKDTKMALIPKSLPKFEDLTITMDDSANPEAGVVQPAQTPVAAVAAAVAPAAVAAVAAVATGAVAIKHQSLNPFSDMEKAYEVDYNTLTQVMATNGGFFEKETSVALGDSLVLQLMSYQSNFIISPGIDGDEAKKLVRYSSDGINTKDGESCSEYIKELKEAGYDKAYMSKRIVLVGALLDAGKAPDMTDSLIQIDLAPTSKTLFDRYVIQSAFNVSKGKTTRENASKLRITAKVAKNANNKIYTLVNFTQA